MANKSKFLKNLLTTASAMAVLASSIGITEAATTQRITVGGANNFTGVGFNPGGFVSGDWIQIGAGGDSLNFDVAGPISVLDINVAANFGGLTLAAGPARSIAIGNIASTGGGAGDLNYNGVVGSTIFLTGGDHTNRNAVASYSGLANIDFVNAVVAQTLEIDTTYNMANTGVGNRAVIDLGGSQVANAGAGTILNVKTDLKTTHSTWGTIGTVNIGTAGQAATFEMGDAGAINAILGDINFLNPDSKLKLVGGGGNNFTVAANKKIGGVVDASGIIEISGSGAGGAIDEAVANNGAAIGKSNAFRAKELQLTGSKNVDIGVPVYAKQITGALTVGKVATFSKAVDGGVVDSTVTFNNTTTMQFDEGLTVHKVDFANNPNGELKIAATKDLITAEVDGDATNAANVAGKLTFLGASNFTGQLKNVKLVTIAGGGEVTFVSPGPHTFERFEFSNANAALKLDKVFTLTGDFIATAAGDGKINVKENSTIIGKISVGGNKINQINFDTDGKILTVDSNGQAGGVNTNTMNFSTGAKDATLLVQNSVPSGGANISQTIIFASGLTTDTPGTPMGIVHFDPTIGSASAVVLQGRVGDITNNKSLKELIVGKDVASANGIYLTLDANDAAGVAHEQNIAKLTIMGATNLNLDTTGAAGTYQFGELNIAAVDNVTLSIANNHATLTILGANKDIGSANGPKLKELKFLTDNKLTLGDGVNIYGTKLTNNAGTTAGKLKFLGNSIFDVPLDAGKTINTIEGPAVAGATATIVNAIKAQGDITGGIGKLEFKDKVETAGNIVVGGTSGVMIFCSDVKAAAINGKTANEGTAVFNNTAVATVTGAVGGVTVHTLQFSGTDVIFNDAVTHTGLAGGNFIIFDSQATTPTTVTLSATALSDVARINITSTAKARPVLQASKINGNTAVLGVIGAAGHPVELRLNFAGNGFANAAVSNLQNAFITTTTNNVGTFEFKVAGDAGGNKVGGLGSKGLALATVTVTESGEVLSDTYANVVAVAGGQTFKTGGVISGDAGTSSITLGNNTSTLDLQNGTTLDSKVIPTGIAGLVVFNGGGTVTQDIGSSAAKVVQVTFKDSTSPVKIKADIYGTDIKAGATTLSFSDTNPKNTRTLGGTVTAKNSTFDLGTTNVVLSGKTVLLNTININTTITVDNNNEVTGGNLAVVNKNMLDINGLSQVNITINDNSTDTELPDINSPRTFTLLQAPKQIAGATRPVIIAGGTGSLTKWTGTFDPLGNIILTQTNNAAETLSTDLAASGATDADNQNALILAKSPSIAILLNRITNSAKRAELVRRGTAVDVGGITSDFSHQVGDGLIARMDSGLRASMIETKVGDNGASGIAAGEASNHRYGAWVTPFYAKSTQKAREEAAGYGANTIGASFGFDTRANDDLIVGIAASTIGSTVKYKNYKSGDRARANSIMFSIYGMQQITDNWFVEGAATYGATKVTIKEKRVISNTAYAKISGDYSSTIFGGQGLFGYSFVAMDNYMITPMIGLRYNTVNDGGYTETGDTPQVLTISKKSTSRFEGILGARLNAGNIDLGMLAVTPEIHGFVTQNINGKSPKTTVTMNDSPTPLATKNLRNKKTFYNLGLGVSAQQGAAEYGLVYDLHLSEKYIGHQGSLKIRVNF